MKPNAAIAGIMLPLTAVVVVGGWIMMRSVDTYFPPELVDDEVCASRTSPKEGAALDELEAGWYGDALRELGEMPLDASANEGRPVMRFTYLPSFFSPISVRLEEQVDGGAIMSAVRGVGFACRPGAADCRVVRRLSAEEWAEVARWRKDLKAMAPTDCVIGVDGTRWVHEDVEAGRYRLVHRWGPEDDAVFRAGVAMLGLTGWRMEPDRELRPTSIRDYIRRHRPEAAAGFNGPQAAAPATPLPARSPAAP